MSRPLVTVRNAWAALAVLFASCTVFDDVVLPDAGTAPDGGAAAGAGGDPRDGGGGAASGGGGAGGGDAAAPPDDAYLSLEDAAKLCALVFACPMVGPSIRASIGVPVMGPGGAPPPTFSHCVHWLAGPLPSTLPDIPGQRKMLEDMAKGTDCPSTLAKAYVEKLVDATDMRCEGATRKCSKDGSEVVDCSARLQVERCGSPLLGSTVCYEAAAVACATETCSFPGSICAGLDLSYCLDGLKQTAGCPQRGLICAPTVPPNCGNNGVVETCSTPGATKCERGVAKLCADPIGTAPIQISQLESPFDCAAIDGGAMCDDSLPSGDGGPGAVRCELAQHDCSPEEDDSCDGASVINICVRGKHTAFDCGKIGKGCGGSPPRCEL